MTQRSSYSAIYILYYDSSKRKLYFASSLYKSHEADILSVSLYITQYIEIFLLKRKIEMYNHTSSRGLAELRTITIKRSLPNLTPLLLALGYRFVVWNPVQRYFLSFQIWSLHSRCSEKKKHRSILFLQGMILLREVFWNASLKINACYNSDKIICSISVYFAGKRQGKRKVSEFYS